MTSAAKFDLRTLIKQTAIAHDTVASPAVIAELVFDSIPADQHEAIIRKLLPRYAGDVLRSTRKRGPATPEQQWQSFLEERVAVGSGHYKFAAECQEPELRQASARRRKMAGALDRRAAVFASVADAVSTHGASVAGELSVSVGAASITDLRVKAATVQTERIAAERVLRRKSVIEAQIMELEDHLHHGTSARVLELEKALATERDRLDQLECNADAMRRHASAYDTLLEVKSEG